MPKMTVAELEAFYSTHFPQMDDHRFKIEKLEDNFAQVRLFYRDSYLRPGGTISGASLMSLADIAMYTIVLAMIGPVALAVTTNLNINFLRKPAPADVIARVRLLKLGSRLAIGEVGMFSDVGDEPVAHATVTYSIPPKQG
ncbi:MAG: PaaI family thioesterase [Acidobacteria bacterium]|nr:PaaI family thioesterase [Acidobacteriota bacterium]